MAKLAENQIETRPLFYPIHTMPPYKKAKKFPVAERLSKNGISLPSAVTLTQNDARRIVSLITSYCKLSNREELSPL